MVHLLVLVHIAHWKISGTTLTPLEPSEAMQTLELGYVNAGFLLFVFLILMTLIVGRFFCGWACHVVAYQDLCAWLLKKIHLKPRPFRSRLLMWIPFGAAFYMFAWPQVKRIWQGNELPEFVAHLSTSNFWETFPGFWMSTLTFAVDGFLIVYLLGAKAFCTYGCPYGAVFAGADRFAPGRIRVTDACEGCAHCTATCTSNVRVHEEVARYGMVVSPGCMKCLDCVNVCPKDALYYGFGKPMVAAALGKRKRTWDFSWPQELGLAALFLAGLFIFRNLYHAVPFLLAIGLGVITTVIAMTFWSLWRRQEFSFQNHLLKTKGRWTQTGKAAAAGMALFLAFTAHSGFIQYHSWQGEVAYRAGRSEKNASSYEEAARYFLTAERYGLFPDPQLQIRIGATYRDLGERPAAIAHFSLALEQDPTTELRLALSTLLLQENRMEEARAMLEEILREEADHAEARRRLRLLEGR